MLAFAPAPPNLGRRVPAPRLKSDNDHAPADPSSDAEASAGSAERRDPDADVAVRARDGDRDAMDVLVQRHQAAVARLLWRFARSRADLDDLVQETFLRMVRGLPNWRAEQPFAHWLLRIATNAGRDYFRREAVRKRWAAEPAPRDGDGEPVLPEAVDPAPDPAARAAANEVKSLLSRLAPDDRALLTLFHLEGWDLARIAAQFGWTVTATKLRAWRARRQLRALLTRPTPS